MTVTAAEGRVMWSYYTAATLRSCTVTLTDGAWSLTGSVATSDAFRLTQRPLTFEVTHQHGRWTWPIQELQIAGAVLTATLGPKES